MGHQFIDWGLCPENFFYRFDGQSDFGFISPRRSRWKTTPLNQVEILNLADMPEDRDRISVEISRTIPTAAGKQIAFSCLPAMMKNVTIHRSLVSVGGRKLLSGAAGQRARSQYSLRNKSRRNELADALSGATKSAVSLSPDWTTAPCHSVPIILDCRNLTNYYHFLSETVAALASISGLARKRRILIHVANIKHATQGFSQRFLQDLFPELAGQIEFINDLAPVHYEECLYPFIADHLFYMLPIAQWTKTERKYIPKHLSAMQTGTDRERNFMRFLGYDLGLCALRKRALKLASDRKTDAGEKILVARREDSSRIRVNDTWDRLRRGLLSYGFREVHLETLSPLEQVATINRASVVVAAHGAGVTNMIFAAPHTRFIEVGNIETTGGRLAVFHQIAQSAGCRYTVVLADRAEAQFHSNGQRILAPISLTDHAIDRILAEAIA